MKIDNIIDSIDIMFMDFDGVITDNNVYTSSDGTELVSSNKYDSLGLKILRELCPNDKLKIIVITTEASEASIQRCKKLDLEIFSAVENKLITAKEILDRFGVPASRALFLCNDLNDLFLTEFVGFSAAPSDAHPLIRKKVDYVSPEKGGRGFVRDVIDRILGDKINLHRYLNIQPI